VKFFETEESVNEPGKIFAGFTGALGEDEIVEVVNFFDVGDFTLLGFRGKFVKFGIFIFSGFVNDRNFFVGNNGKKAFEVRAGILGNTNKMAAETGSKRKFETVSGDYPGVMPGGIDKRREVVDSSKIGTKGWGLGPVGGVKNMAWSDELFDRDEVEAVPQPVEKSWRQTIMKDLKTAVFFGQAGDFSRKRKTKRGKEEFVGVSFIDGKKVADKIESVVANAGAVRDGGNVDTDDHEIF